MNQGDARRPLVGYVWWCGDEWCDCYQPRILRQRVTDRGIKVWEAIWEGQFRSDSDLDGATNELNRTAQAMRRKCHSLYEQIEWPWTVEGSQ